jgi:hypothetical protein
MVLGSPQQEDVVEDEEGVGVGILFRGQMSKIRGRQIQKISLIFQSNANSRQAEIKEEKKGV